MRRGHFFRLPILIFLFAAVFCHADDWYSLSHFRSLVEAYSYDLAMGNVKGEPIQDGKDGLYHAAKEIHPLFENRIAARGLILRSIIEYARHINRALEVLLALSAGPISSVFEQEKTSWSTESGTKQRPHRGSVYSLFNTQDRIRTAITALLDESTPTLSSMQKKDREAVYTALFGQDKRHDEIPLTIKAAAMGTISFTLWAGASMYSGSAVKYTRNGVYEGTINNGTSANISVSTGDEISFYGNNSVYYQYDSYQKEKFSRISCGVTPCFVYGNIMSLVNGLKKYSEDPDESITSDFASATELADLWNTFNSLFRGNSYLMSHSLPLVLPATKLTDYCYMNMFTECYGLTKAPELPATTLARGCYAEMFSHCWKLVKGPSELPATEMKEGSCRMMFYDCEKLASAPVLRATTLAGSCYRYMFSQCKELTRAPDLIATMLESECYVGMFKECSKLNYVKCLATGGLTDANTSAWLTDVSQTGTFVKASSADVSQIAIPSGWTVTTE